MIRWMVSVVIVLMLFVGQEARAQFLFNLSPDVRTLLPSGTVSFIASLQNATSVEIFLNGDSFDLFGTGLSVDDAKFFLNTPLSLQPGESWSGEIFDVAATSVTLPDTYSGTFRILGGSDSSALDIIGERSFAVVVPIPANASEPSTLLLVIVSVVFSQHKRRK
ncbi:hypothetical protein [Armatimonas sp.]|uniref:hypothetical protein n=1 Tax=Armatimonas sp. TaxID=1872638 RepID=UPI00374C9F5A